MSNPATPQISVLGVPDLAETLTLLGFDVIGPEHLAPGVSVIASAATEADAIQDLGRNHPGSRLVVLARHPAGPEQTRLPILVNDLLAAAGWGPSIHPLGLSMVTEDERIPELEQYRPAAREASVWDGVELTTGQTPENQVEDSQFDQLVAAAAAQNLSEELVGAQLDADTEPATDLPSFDDMIEAQRQQTDATFVSNPSVAEPEVVTEAAFDGMVEEAKRNNMRQHDRARPEVPAAPTELDVLRALGEQFVADSSTVPFIPSAAPANGSQLQLELSGGGPRGKVLVFYGSKGGVGRTTFALLMAQRAAIAGLKVVFVEVTRGYGSVRSYLGLADAGLPTLQNAAVTGQPGDAILPPSKLVAVRAGSLPRVPFGVVLAPPVATFVPAHQINAAYNAVIAYAQTQADLVILDTAVGEPHDMAGVTDDIILPVFGRGAWGLGMTDTSVAGAEQLLATTKEFSTRGVSRNRLLMLINRVREGATDESVIIQQTLDQYVTFIGAAAEDSALAHLVNSGRPEGDNPTARRVSDAVLHRITGNPVFLPQAASKRHSPFAKR